MSNSFTNQVIARSSCSPTPASTKKQVYVLPKHLDEEGGPAAPAGAWCRADSADQGTGRLYRRSMSRVPYKPEYYRYLAAPDAHSSARSCSPGSGRYHKEFSPTSAWRSEPPPTARARHTVSSDASASSSCPRWIWPTRGPAHRACGSEDRPSRFARPRSAKIPCDTGPSRASRSAR